MSEQNKALMRWLAEEFWNQKNPAVIDQLYHSVGRRRDPHARPCGHCPYEQHRQRLGKLDCPYLRQGCRRS
jgi:hypothetical protein